jgi:hypothetical protein
MLYLPNARRGWLWLSLCGWLCVCHLTAEATLMKYLEIEDLARLSTEVVQGQVLSTRSYWDDSHTRILTAVRVQVDDCFKGSSKRGATVTINQLGGELDGLRQDFSGRPLFKAGESVVLFARALAKNELHLVGLKQGKLLVSGNEARRELGGISFIDAAVGAKDASALTTAAGKPLKTVQMRYNLDELRERIARVR